MTAVVCDASVVLKWFNRRGEEEVDAARAIVQAHIAGSLRAHVLDLTYYEVGNAALRSLRWSGERAEQMLDELEELCGAGIPVAGGVRGTATRLAAVHGLTLYDASYWAVALAGDCMLVTADRQLIAAGAGLSPRAAAAALGLHV